MKESEERYYEIQCAEYEAGKSGNYLARLIFSKYRNWKLNKCWSMQPKIDRTAFAALFSQGSKLDFNEEANFSGAEPAAYQPTRFNLDDIYPEISSGNRQLDADKAITALTELDAIWSQHNFIAVPKMIRHDKHRDKILDEIAALIPKSSSKGITYKPTGSALGSQAQWDSYLLFEEWTKAGYGRGRACGLVAWEKYEAKSVRQDFGQTPKARKQAAADFLATSIGKKEPDKKNNVESHVTLIEKAIKSVFPLFVPFYCKPMKP